MLPALMGMVSPEAPGSNQQNRVNHLALATTGGLCCVATLEGLQGQHRDIRKASIQPICLCGYSTRPAPTLAHPTPKSYLSLPPCTLVDARLPVLGLDVVGKGLGLLVTVVVVTVVVVLGTNVLHLVDAAALGAPLNRALAGHLDVARYVSKSFSSPPDMLVAARWMDQP